MDDILGPDGEPLTGVIAVSDETSDRIYNRLNKKLVSILPEAQGKNLQLEGIKNYLDKNISKLETREKIEFTNKFNEYIKELQTAGYNLELLPQESEQERQARDYDGDCIGFEQASKYPNLTAEALERNLPENAYDPTIKLKKQSFYREDGSQPEFEEIAIHMSDGISVGVINNHLTSIEALESEITILKNFGSEKDQIEYVQAVAKHYEDLFKTEAWAKSKGVEGKEVPERYRGYIEEFVQTAKQEPLDQETAFKAMSINTRMYREMIESAAFQNQIAVDLFKSAKKPEMEIIRNNSRILHREVNYIRDKKKDVYIESTIQPTGYSPVELLIAKTNQYFEKARLESRELVQFQDLFKGVEFSNQQRLQATLAKKEFDESFNRANQLSRQKETEKGPSANITLANGERIRIANLLQYDSDLIWTANKITFKLSEIPEEKRNSSQPHKYLVHAQINDETENGKPKFRALGTLAKEQENNLEETGISLGQEVTSNKISFQPELSEGQIKLLYQKAYQAAEEFYNSIPPDQKLAMAAATWAASTTRESNNEKGSDRQNKVSNFVFAALTQEILAQLDTLKFTEFSITGFDRSSQVLSENQPQNIRFNIAENGKDVIEIQTLDGHYETFGNIEQNNARLPIGTTSAANIKKGEVYTVSVTAKVPGTSAEEFTFKVGEVNRFNKTSQRFNNEPAMLTIQEVKLAREDYSIYIQNGNKEEKLGNIDKESVKEGDAQGWLKPETRLQLKVQTITTGQNAYAIGETTDGHLLRINITNSSFKTRKINQSFKALVKAFDKKYVYVAKIGDRQLGIIGQHTERLEAETKGNPQRKWQSKKSLVQELIEKGIINTRQICTTLPVRITSNESTCKITINPETVQYPDQWIKRNQLIKKQTAVYQQNEKNNQESTQNVARSQNDILNHELCPLSSSHQILFKINERPAIMFQDKEQKLVGLVGLAIDEQLATKTKKYLETAGVSYEQLPVSQARLEAKKGMTVFMLDESTINDELKQKFIDRSGGIKNADNPAQPIPIISEQTVYFYNPNQQYSSADGLLSETKEAIGLVVPAQDSIAVAAWLELKGAENDVFIENNTATFIFGKNEALTKELNALLGEAIDIGGVEGFERYEQLSAELNQKLETQGSLLSSNHTTLDSEYRQTLKTLPNRPKELSRLDAPVPIVVAKPIAEEVKSSGQDIRVQAQATKKLASNSGDQVQVAILKQAQASGGVLSEQTTNPAQATKNEAIQLPSARLADPTRAIEILGKIRPDKIEQVRSHLETHLKPVLEEDKSSYAPSRQVAWVGAKWDLKEKNFKPAVQDDALMQLVKQVYPDADIVLVTYSENTGEGINYHRDDSYAAIEARSINIGNSDWGYRAAKEQMAWTKEENTAATYQEFKLESGTVTRFNCKNEHAAINTEAGRWSINIWSVKNDLGRENSDRQKFENFLASNQPPRAVVNSNDDLTIKADEWTPGGEMKVERSYANLKEVTRNISSHFSNQPSVQELISIGSQTAARAMNPQIPENPTISGKPVPMVFPLHLHGESSKVPVNTTIDAMRGYGRVHTTRGVDYQKTYGIKEGDIALAEGGRDSAIAVGKNGEQVAFRVGKQYEITPQMIQNPVYQQAWANWEKHSPKELIQTQANKSKVYGLFMEPLGDYVNGKIVPFPSVQKQTATSINISPDSKDGLGAALANATALAKEQGKLQNDYRVSLNNNPEAAAGRYGVETHNHKPATLPYASAEHAFNHQKQLHPTVDEYKLMVQVLQAKLEQHPQLGSAIAKRCGEAPNAKRGGTEWLENCTNITNAQDKKWEGKGKESAFIRALTEAYNNVVEKSQQTTISPSPSPKVQSQPIKVISGGQTGADMGALRGAKALGLVTGGTAAAGWMTENGANPTLQEYGLVEGEKGDTAVLTYNKRTVENIRNADGTAIFGNVNSPGSRLTVQIAQNLGKPVLHVPLDTALNNRPAAAQQLRDFVEQNNIQTLNIAGNRESKAPGLEAAVAQIVQIGLAYQQNRENIHNPPDRFDAQQTEKPVINSKITPSKVHTQHLDIEQALASSTSTSKQQVGVMDGIIKQMKANTVQNLQDWYIVAQKLGKSEKYLNRIQEVTDSYIKENISLENAFKFMEKDVKELEKINELTSLAQRVVKTIGLEDSNGIMSVQTEKYQIATKAQNQTYLVKDKNDNVLLYVQE
ncbi:MAG: putative molybdenum carrier protein, partial [Scytonema sp. PMC 1069.18]|nr:putative molybdenum carrier protein [Scytonema sp. PMC 1069.18]